MEDDMKLRYGHPVYNGKENRDYWNVFIDNQYAAQVKTVKGKVNFFKTLPREFSSLRSTIIKDVEKLENISNERSTPSKQCEEFAKNANAHAIFKLLLYKYEMWSIDWKDEELFSAKFFSRFGKETVKKILEDIKKL